MLEKSKQVQEFLKLPGLPPEDTLIQCNKCGGSVFYRDHEENELVCYQCNKRYPAPPRTKEDKL